MQHDDQTAQAYGAPPPAPSPAQPPSIGLGPRLAITAGVVVVLVTVSSLVEWIVTDRLGLSLWTMCTVYVTLAALALRSAERASRGDLNAMWFAAWIAWVAQAFDALAAATGIWEVHLAGGAVAAVLAWRWVDVRRRRRERVTGPLLKGSS